MLFPARCNDGSGVFARLMSAEMELLVGRALRLQAGVGQGGDSGIVSLEDIVYYIRYEAESRAIFTTWYQNTA
jgi:hypothetical protein